MLKVSNMCLRESKIYIQPITIAILLQIGNVKPVRPGLKVTSQNM